MNKIIIIGSGCSSLASAYALSKDKNNEITIITADDAPGKKYLVTGNGRCNIGNLNAFKKDFNCYVQDNKFTPSFFTEEDKNRYFAYLKEAGIDLFCDEENRLYPFSFTASNVQKQLVDIIKNKVKFQCSRKVLRINKYDKQVILEDNSRLNYDKLVIACGGLSSFYYEEIIQSIEVDHAQFSSALTSIIPNFTWPKRITGQKLKGLLTIYIGQEKYQESGELLFKEKELSGIMTFNSSLLINNKSTISIDLTRYKSYSANSQNSLSYLPLKVYEVLNELPIKNGILKFEAKVAPNSKNAQVLKGGVKISEINLNNMSLKDDKNIHIIGEALDYTGLCGGYNILAAIITGLKTSL